jgi:predicted RNase H-like HicB family nuclease
VYVHDCLAQGDVLVEDVLLDPCGRGARICGPPVLLFRMHLRIETELEDDGRWIAEIPQLPGVLAYGASAEEARTRAEILALRVLAGRLEYGEERPIESSIALAVS